LGPPTALYAAGRWPIGCMGQEVSCTCATGVVVDVSDCKPTKACRNIAEDCAMPMLGPMDDVDDHVVANSKLLNASAEGNLTTMQQALEEGADVNTRMPLRICILECDPVDNMDSSPGFQDNGEGWKDPDVPQAASLKIEEEPDWCDPLGSNSASLTPLMHAAMEGHAKALVLLLSARAIPGIKDSEGMQALHYAASSGSQEACRVLLDSGANPLSKDENEHDALDFVPADAMFSRKEQLEWQVLLRRPNATDGTKDPQLLKPIAPTKQTTDGTSHAAPSLPTSGTTAAAPCLLSSGYSL